MSTDALDAMNQYNDAAYTDLLDEASKDDRVGKQRALVTSVVDDTWPQSGDPRKKVHIALLTANNAKADITISPLPPPEVIVAQKATWDRAKKQAIASSITIHKGLAQHYGKRPDDIREGDVYEVQTVKTRRDESTGKGGFIRVVAFLAPGSVNGTAAPASGGSGGPGF